MYSDVAPYICGIILVRYRILLKKKLKLKKKYFSSFKSLFSPYPIKVAEDLSYDTV